MKHIIAAKEAGRFFGWPANNGIWSWGNEIVVGYTKGGHEEKEKGHSISRELPAVSLVSRSLDGGETWKEEKPENYGGKKPDENLIDLQEKINFSHPDLAIRCWHDLFQVSYDRCRSWKGPHLFPDFGFEEELTSRTGRSASGRKTAETATPLQ